MNTEPNWDLVARIINSRLAHIGGGTTYRAEYAAGRKKQSLRTLERARVGSVNMEKKGARELEGDLDLPEQSLRLAAERKYDDLLDLLLPDAIQTLVREAQREDGHPSGPTRNRKAM